MNIINCEAIVLKRFRFSESSMILNLFTKEYGRIDVLAKGILKNKSILFSHLDYFAQEEVTIYQRKKTDLDIITEAYLIEENVGIRFSAIAFAMAGILADVILNSYILKEPQEEIYDILKKNLQKMSYLILNNKCNKNNQNNINNENEKIINNTIKSVLMILNITGFKLNLEDCAKCGEKIKNNKYMSFEKKNNGFICEKCKKIGKIYVISKKQYDVLKNNNQSKNNNENFNLNISEYKIIMKIIVEYVQYVNEKALNSKNNLLQIINSYAENEKNNHANRK